MSASFCFAAAFARCTRLATSCVRLFAMKRAFALLRECEEIGGRAGQLGVAAAFGASGLLARLLRARLCLE